jgi:hypothetical protein
MKLELALAFCKLTKYEYYKKLGKRKKAGRKPTSITAQINKLETLYMPPKKLSLVLS